MNSEWATDGGTGSSPRGAWRCAALAAAVWLACLTPCPGLEFQQGAVINLQHFKTQGRTDQGARWYLDGQSAVVRGAIYDLTGVVLRVEDDNGRTAVIRAQACTYYQDSGLVESNAPVRVETGEVTLQGLGFDMLIAERRLKVRDAVRMEVPSAKAKLGAFGPTDPAAGTTAAQPQKTGP